MRVVGTRWVALVGVGLLVALGRGVRAQGLWEQWKAVQTTAGDLLHRARVAAQYVSDDVLDVGSCQFHEDLASRVESALVGEIVAQTEAVEEVVSAVRLWDEGGRGKPLVLVLAGSTGTGKTFAADLLAGASLRGRYYRKQVGSSLPRGYLRLDGSHFMQASSVEQLEDALQAHLRICKRGGVILLDEAQKVHVEVVDRLLTTVQTIPETVVLLTSDMTSKQVQRTAEVAALVASIDTNFRHGLRGSLLEHWRDPGASSARRRSATTPGTATPDTTAEAVVASIAGPSSGAAAEVDAKGLVQEAGDAATSAGGAATSAGGAATSAGGAATSAQHADAAAATTTATAEGGGSEGQFAGFRAGTSRAVGDLTKYVTAFVPLLPITQNRSPAVLRQCAARVALKRIEHLALSPRAAVELAGAPYVRYKKYSVAKAGSEKRVDTEQFVDQGARALCEHDDGPIKRIERLALRLLPAKPAALQALFSVDPSSEYIHSVAVVLVCAAEDPVDLFRRRDDLSVASVASCSDGGDDLRLVAIASVGPETASARFAQPRAAELLRAPTLPDR